MRPQGRMAVGYFPCPHEALDRVLPYIQPPEGQWSILDPCAGGGEAVQHIASTLGCAEGNVYAIELETYRAQRLRELMPSANVLGPCSFFGCKVGAHTVSLLYLNPPFDDSGDGSGRVERQFMDQANALLAPGGVLFLVAPEKIVRQTVTSRSLMAWYDHIWVEPFPEHCRRFNEVAVLAVKRRHICDPDKRRFGEAYVTDPILYPLPVTNGPGQRFTKLSLTDEEIEGLLASSPLRRLLNPPPEAPLPRPPLELGTGHVALLLASGHLDGLVRHPDEPPHVVRGVAVKVEETTDVSTVEGDGETITKTTISERISMFVRAVGPDGVIHNLTQEGANLEPEPEPVAE